MGAVKPRIGLTACCAYKSAISARILSVIACCFCGLSFNSGIMLLEGGIFTAVHIRSTAFFG